MASTMQFNELFGDCLDAREIGCGYGFTEGPAADGQGNVYFSDGQNDSIYLWRVHGAPERFVSDSTDAIGMMLNSCGELYVCEGAAHRVVAIDPATNAKRVLCDQIDGIPFNEPNDLAIDFHDGFYFSDPNYQHRGQPTLMKQDVYYCSAAGQVTRVSTVCFKPNGVLLSADDKTLYVADARGQRIWCYDVVAPGVLTRERLWIDKIAANPDGLTLDEYDNLYICCGKAGLKVYDRYGAHLGTIPVHAANCCFGGGDFKTLLIASADKFRALETNATGIKPLVLRR